MSHWISKAANAFKGDDSSSAQTFELSCECGQRHQGIRRQKWQRIVCRDCGGSLFVLQRDVYPAPKEKPVTRASPAVVEEEPEQLEPAAEVIEEITPRRESARSLPPSGVKESPSKRTLRPVVVAPSQSSRKSPGGFWKPFRVIMAVILLLGTATGFQLFRSSQRIAAEKSLKSAIDEIKDALLRGEWVEARNQLEIAVASIDRLGRTDADALRYRQQLRETTALTSLLSQPLSDLLEEASQAQAISDAELATFQFKVKGQWLFIEGHAEPIQTVKKSARVQYQISLPVAVGKDNLLAGVVIVSSDLSRYLTKSKPESVIVAVQIDAIQLSEDKSKWLIVTNPESTVLWAYRETYLGIGYTAHEADLVVDTLAHQANSLGVTPEVRTE